MCVPRHTRSPTHRAPPLGLPDRAAPSLRIPILRRRVNPRGFLAPIPIFRRVGTAGGGDFLESPVFNSPKIPEFPGRLTGRTFRFTTDWSFPDFLGEDRYPRGRKGGRQGQKAKGVTRACRREKPKEKHLGVTRGAKGKKPKAFPEAAGSVLQGSPTLALPDCVDGTCRVTPLATPRQQVTPTVRKAPAGSVFQGRLFSGVSGIRYMPTDSLAQFQNVECRGFIVVFLPMPKCRIQQIRNVVRKGSAI